MKKLNPKSETVNPDVMPDTCCGKYEEDNSYLLNNGTITTVREISQKEEHFEQKQYHQGIEKFYEEEQPKDLEACYESFIRSNHLSREWEKHYEEWHNGEHIEQPLKSAGEILDLMQYVTNMVYYAKYQTLNMNEVQFDKWVEDQIEGINEYFKNQNKDTTDEEINKKIFELTTSMRTWDGKSNPKTIFEYMFEIAVWVRSKVKSNGTI